MVKYLSHRWRLFKPVLAGGSLKDRLIACIGALIGISLTAVVCAATVGPEIIPWLVAPIGATAVLLFAVPASPLAQPWPVIGGNIISAFVGVAAARTIASPALAAGIAVAGAIFVMSVFRCLHPPGGAAALLAVIGGKSAASLGFLFPLLPVGLNSLLLVIVGLIFHRFSGHSYPHRAIPVSGHRIVPDTLLDIHPRDMDLALEDLGETFDISREDLELLFRQVEFHARERRMGA
ncbi:HPP family protein [Parasphingorhabdus sp.]|uniref:HPP family protein n=1 Tax=Parasphingorhabdus sp. TaxID=2709688 RepID=UPI0035938902